MSIFEIYVIICVAFAIMCYFTVRNPAHNIARRIVYVAGNKEHIKRFNSSTYKIAESLVFLILVAIAMPLVFTQIIKDTKTASNIYAIKIIEGLTND